MKTTLKRSYYPKYIKNSHNSTPKNSNNPIKKWTEDLNKHFFQEGTQTELRGKINTDSESRLIAQGWGVVCGVEGSRKKKDGEKAHENGQQNGDCRCEGVGGGGRGYGGINSNGENTIK